MAPWRTISALGLSFEFAGFTGGIDPGRDSENWDSKNRDLKNWVSKNQDSVYQELNRDSKQNGVGEDSNFVHREEETAMP
jgi:hypothetical protein